MYIDPFAAGILTTLGAEILLLIAVAIVAAIKKKGGRK